MGDAFHGLRHVGSAKIVDSWLVHTFATILVVIGCRGCSLPRVCKANSMQALLRFRQLQNNPTSACRLSTQGVDQSGVPSRLHGGRGRLCGGGVGTVFARKPDVNISVSRLNPSVIRS